jgi:hypothetical protein
MESFRNDDLITASFSEFDRQLYIRNAGNPNDSTNTNFSNYLQEFERQYMEAELQLAQPKKQESIQSEC